MMRAEAIVLKKLHIVCSGIKILETGESVRSWVAASPEEIEIVAVLAHFTQAMSGKQSPNKPSVALGCSE